MDQPRTYYTEQNQSERERDISYSNTHIRESRKMVLKNLFTGQQKRNKHREHSYGHGEKGGEGEMYANSNMETSIAIW